MTNPYGTKQTPRAVSATTSAGVLSAAGNWLSRTFQNTGSVDVTIGGSGVVAGTGLLIAAGKSFTDSITKDAWYVITASSTSTIQVQEVL